MCLVTLAGCGNKEKPKQQYVAEVSRPYINTLKSFNKELDVSYQFQNTLSKEGDYDMILGRTEIPLDVEIKHGDKLRIVGEANVFYAEDESKNTTLTDEIGYTAK